MPSAPAVDERTGAFYHYRREMQIETVLVIFDAITAFAYNPSNLLLASLKSALILPGGQFEKAFLSLLAHRSLYRRGGGPGDPDGGCRGAIWPSSPLPTQLHGFVRHAVDLSAGGI
jgi:hypothetical protein